MVCRVEYIPRCIARPIQRYIPQCDFRCNESGGSELPEGQTDPAVVVGSDEGVVIDPTNGNTLFEETTGGSAGTVTSVDGPVGTIKDLSGNGFHFTAPSDAARPILRLVGGHYYLEFDGVNHEINATISGLGTSATLIASINPLDTSEYVFLRDQATAYLLHGHSLSILTAVSGLLGSLLYRRNGASILLGTRGLVHSTLVSKASVMTFQSLDLSSSTLVGIGRGSNKFRGRLYGGMLIKRSITSSERSGVEKYLGAKAGLSW